MRLIYFKILLGMHKIVTQITTAQPSTEATAKKSTSVAVNYGLVCVSVRLCASVCRNWHELDRCMELITMRFASYRDSDKSYASRAGCHLIRINIRYFWT